MRLELVRDAAGYRVVFERLADRYSHRIEVVQGDASQILLRSLEGDDQAAWPPSPPLQQLALELHPRGDTIALAVGMAGASHWSLSVDSRLADMSCEVDVACRATPPPQWLGSVYQVTGSCHLESPSAALVECPLGGLRVTLEAADECVMDWDAALRRLSVRPLALSQRADGASVRSVRWKYRLQPWASTRRQ